MTDSSKGFRQDDDYDEDEEYDEDDELDEDEQLQCAIEGVDGFFSRVELAEAELLETASDWAGFKGQVQEPNAREIVLNYLAPSSFEKVLQPVRRLLKQEVYKISLDERVLFRSRKSLGLVRQKKVCSLSELCGVAVSASFKQTGSKEGYTDNSWWEYGISLVRNNGEVIHVLQREQLPFLSVVHDAKLLASKLNLSFYPAQKERYLRAIKTPDGVEVQYVEPKWSDYLRDFSDLISFKD